MDFRSGLVRTSDFRINATHILRIAGQSRQMRNIAKENRDEYFEVVTGAPKYQASYVDFEVGLRLCQKYGLVELKKRLWQIPRSGQAAHSQLLEKTHSSQPNARGLPLERRPDDADINCQTMDRTPRQPRAGSDLPEKSSIEPGEEALSSANSPIPSGLVPQGEFHAKGGGRVYKTRDTAISDVNITSCTTMMHHKAQIPAGKTRSPILENDALSRPRGDETSSSFPEPQRSPARNSNYSAWDPEPQYSRLTEVKPDLGPDNTKISSLYGSFMNTSDSFLRGVQSPTYSLQVGLMSPTEFLFSNF